VVQCVPNQVINSHHIEIQGGQDEEAGTQHGYAALALGNKLVP